VFPLNMLLCVNTVVIYPNPRNFLAKHGNICIIHTKYRVRWKHQHT